MFGGAVNLTSVLWFGFPLAEIKTQIQLLGGYLCIACLLACSYNSTCYISAGYLIAGLLELIKHFISPSQVNGPVTDICSRRYAKWPRTTKLVLHRAYWRWQGWPPLSPEPPAQSLGVMVIPHAWMSPLSSAPASPIPGHEGEQQWQPREPRHHFHVRILQV